MPLQGQIAPDQLHPRPPDRAQEISQNLNKSLAARLEFPYTSNTGQASQFQTAIEMDYKMSDTSGVETQTTTAENTGEMPAEISGAAEPDKFTLSDVTKRYFSPDQLQDAQNYLPKIVEVATAGQIKRNFDPEKPFPDGYGLAIVPLSKRTEGKGNVTIGVAIAAIPDPELVSTHEKGAEFIRSIITDQFIAKVANACRPRPDGTTAPTIPYEITDFLESRRGRESLKAFSEIAPLFVKALRKKGITFLTAQVLRQTLQSKQFAEAQFEKIGQEAWEKVLDSMIVKATAEGHDAAVLVNWRETRDETEVSMVGEIDLAEFDNLV